MLSEALCSERPFSLALRSREWLERLETRSDAVRSSEGTGLRRMDGVLRESSYRKTPKELGGKTMRIAKHTMLKNVILLTPLAEICEPTGEGMSSPWGVEASIGPCSATDRRREGGRSSLPRPSSPPDLVDGLQANKQVASNHSPIHYCVCYQWKSRCRCVHSPRLHAWLYIYRQALHFFMAQTQIMTIMLFNQVPKLLTDQMLKWDEKRKKEKEARVTRE